MFVSSEDVFSTEQTLLFPADDGPGTKDDGGRERLPVRRGHRQSGTVNVLNPVYHSAGCLSMWVSIVPDLEKLRGPERGDFRYSPG